jgi:hypothetical protein
MSGFNGSGTFVISGSGLPYVVDTIIDETVANQLNTDLGTGLSTCITKDGQTTTTQRIPFAMGASFAQPIIYGGVTLANSVTGTGSMVLSANPTFTGTLNASLGNFNGSTLGVGVLEAAAGSGAAITAYHNGSSGGHAIHCQVQDTSVSLIQFNFGGGVVGTITTNGTNTAYNTSSDAILKDNVQDSGDAGAILDALKVRQWDWKSSGAHENFGFVAQEEHEVAPFAVTPGDKDRYWARDDSKLVPLLVKEIQSLRRRLEAAGL